MPGLSIRCIDWATCTCMCVHTCMQGVLGGLLLVGPHSCDSQAVYLRIMQCIFLELETMVAMVIIFIRNCTNYVVVPLATWELVVSVF